MNSKSTSLRSATIVAALAACLALTGTEIQAQGIVASATLTSTPDAVNGFDYTITLNNAANATTSIQGFWYAWIPGFFFLPTEPSSAGPGTSGWTPSIVSTSIQYQGNAGNAIAPGQSATFTFVSTDTPAALAGTSQGHPIGESVAYPGTINFSGSSPNETFTVVSPTPEPSTYALLAGGSLMLLAMGWRKRQGNLALAPVKKG